MTSPRGRTPHGLALLACTAAVALAACAARERGPAPTATPAERAAPGDVAPGAPRPEQPPESRAPSPPPGETRPAPDTQAPSVVEPRPATPSSSAGATTPSVLPPNSDKRREMALRHARAEVEQAKRELDASGSDCGAACRALASLERATGHLCELAGDTEDRRSCEDARRRVVSAREHIRSACGGGACGAAGPRLDPGAPIPSRR